MACDIRESRVSEETSTAKCRVSPPKPEVQNPIFRIALLFFFKCFLIITSEIEMFLKKRWLVMTNKYISSFIFFALITFKVLINNICLVQAEKVERSTPSKKINNPIHLYSCT